jgi:EmrB/QacA subfamily drug resistance transporter
MDKKRLALLAAIMGSAVAGLDATVVNVALPAIEEDVGGGLAGQQWVSNAYLLTLSALILIGGSLGDLYGERRVFSFGVLGFGVASLLCALAPTIGVLVGARALQGVFGALLTPSALAVIVATFPPSERGAAVGAWTAWSGIAYMVGPLVGGLLVDEASWRWIFAINVPLVAVTLVLIAKAVDERPREGPRPHVDVVGAVLCAVGLAGPTYGLVRQPELGWSHPEVALPIVAGGAVFAGFLVWEARSRRPMMPLELFARRNFAAGNLQTLLMYGGLSISLFLLTLFLQQVAGYSALEAGLATMPTTVVMFLLSRRMGFLADRFGPRRFMGFGPLVAAAGLLLYQRVGEDAPYVTEVLPAILVFAVGLSMTVAPLTAAVLADADEHNAGIASGINNAIARVAGLLGVALVGVLTGERLDVAGFHDVLLLSAVLVAAAGVIGLALVQDPQRDVPCADCPGGALAGAPLEAVAAEPARAAA